MQDRSDEVKIKVDQSTDNNFRHLLLEEMFQLEKNIAELEVADRRRVYARSGLPIKRPDRAVDKRKLVIADIKRNSPEISAREICKKMDQRAETAPSFSPRKLGRLNLGCALTSNPQRKSARTFRRSRIFLDVTVTDCVTGNALLQAINLFSLLDLENSITAVRFSSGRVTQPEEELGRGATRGLHVADRSVFEVVHVHSKTTTVQNRRSSVSSRHTG